MRDKNKILVGKKYERELRKNASATEKQFRKLLNTTKKRFKLHNVKYYFQKGWYEGDAFYISDFYFPITKCTVELDGRSHEKRKQKVQDEKKTAYLSSIGVKTIRLSNGRVWMMTTDDLFRFLFVNRVI